MLTIPAKSRIPTAWAILAAVTVACAATPASAADPIGQQAPAKTLRWLSYKDPVRIEGQKRAIGEFQRRNGITLAISNGPKARQRAKLMDMIGEGRPPEIMGGDTDHLAVAVQAKALTPIKPEPGGGSEPDLGGLSGVSGSALGAWTHKGRLWGVPYSFNPVVMFVNTDLFNDAGVPVPTPDWEDRGWNWRAYVDTAERLTRRDHDGTPVSAGIDSLGPYSMWPWYFGGEWTDDGMTRSRLTGPSTIKALQGIADLASRMGMVGSGAFVKGKAAMTTVPTWYAASLKWARFRWDLAAVPWAGDHTVPVYVEAFSIGSGGEGSEAASFIKWVRGDRARLGKWVDVDGGGCSIPADRDLFKELVTGNPDKPRVRLRVAVDALNHSKPVGLASNPNWFKIDGLLGGIADRILEGGAKAKDILKSANPAFVKLLSDPDPGN